VFCKKGALELAEAEFLELKGAYEGEDIFKSPKHGCRLGFDQPFKVVAIEDITKGSQIPEQKVSTGSRVEVDPIQTLKEEHQVVLKKLGELENLVRKRDIDRVWFKVAEIENEILLHSIKKEEEFLFPYIIKNVPMGIAYVNIMNEDHKEFISLLHSFRCALQEDEILDGIISSVIVNMRNHITKEDQELFAMVYDVISDEDKLFLDRGMKKLEKEHVRVEAGDRSEKIQSPYLENRKYMDAEIAHIKQKSTTDDWSCH